MIFLYTTYYNEKNKDRRTELQEAIRRNSFLKEIASVTIFNEGDSLININPDKIHEILVPNRPTYSDFIAHINAQNQDDAIHIIANTDIFFDEHIGVLSKIALENICLALGRWDTTESLKPVLYNHNDSQDAWVFKGKIKSGLKPNYPLGVPRCDNRLMYDLEEAGYTVLNPSFSIRAYHLHKGQVHVVYTEDDNKYQIAPPYRYKYPHNLYGFVKTYLFNLTSSHKLGSYKYDIKKANRWIPIKIYRFLLRKITGKEMSLIGYDKS